MYKRFGRPANLIKYIHHHSADVFNNGKISSTKTVRYIRPCDVYN